MTGPLHVVMFLPRQVHTGGERYVVEVFSYLQCHDLHVTPIYLDDYPRWVRKLGLAIDCLVNNLWFFWRIMRLSDVNWNRVVFFEDAYSRPRLTLFNYLARIRARRPTTIVLVQSELTNHQLLRNHLLRQIDDWISRLFFEQASLVLANSEFIRLHVLSRGVAPSKVKVIYCGFEGLQDELDMVPKTPKPDRGIQRILFVGQCEPHKGIDVLLRAIAQLKQNKQHSFVVDIVGSTAANFVHYQQLQEIVKREQLEEQVHFWGHIGDPVQLRSFYEQADLFVLPSRHEGFGIVLMEAMSFGLPIVATTAGAIPELVEDGVRGLQVPPDNPTALAKALGKLLQFPDLRKQLGQNGYAFAHDKREFYSWDAVGTRVLSHLRTLESAAQVLGEA